MNRPLRIAVDARALAGPDVFTGYSEYLTKMVTALLDQGCEVTLLSNRPLLKEHGVTERCPQKIIGKPEGFWGRKLDIGFWENTHLHRHLHREHYDGYFAPSNRGVPLRKTKGTPYIAAILDVIPFIFVRQYFLGGRLQFIRCDLIPFLTAVYRSDRIVTISQHAANEISKLFHRHNVMFVPFTSLVAIKEPKAGFKKEFVYVGGQNPRKRVDTLLNAFSMFNKTHPGYKLILIGRAYESYKMQIQELGLQSAVEITGYISEVAKKTRISQSAAMVYPSLYEGYGLAIAEGLEAGVPVIAGRGGAQVEVGQDAVLYIDPTNAQEIYQAMEQVLDLNVRSNIRTKRDRLLAASDPKAVKQQIYNYFKGVL